MTSRVAAHSSAPIAIRAPQKRAVVVDIIWPPRAVVDPEPECRQGPRRSHRHHEGIGLHRGDEARAHRVRRPAEVGGSALPYACDVHVATTRRALTLDLDVALPFALLALGVV